MTTQADGKDSPNNDATLGKALLKRFARSRAVADTQSDESSPSSISSDITIDGNVSCRGKAHFDGEVKGNVECNHLIVGKNGHIIGDVKAEQVVVFGKVEGTIHCLNIALKSGADVRGDIYHSGIAIEMGASFLGRSDLIVLETESVVPDEPKPDPRPEIQSVPLVATARN